MTIRPREFLAGAAAVGLLATGACHQPLFEDSAPPPSPYVDQPQVEQPPYRPYIQPPPPPPPQTYAPQQPDQQYALPPPPPPGRGLAGGPPPGRPPQQPEAIILMAPIPNPEDLSPQDRERVYGPGERAQHELAGGRSTTAGASPQGRVYARPPGATASAATSSQGGSQRPHAVRSSSPSASAPKPKISRPAAVSKPAPRTQAAAPKAAPTNAEQLGAALAGDVTNGATLDIPAAIANGSDGIVTLTLPPSLLTRLKSEADKVGLGLAARSADVTAALSGDGYDVTPSPSQSTALHENESATLAWQVSPGNGASGKLSTKIGADLKGASQPQHVDITTLDRDVAAKPGDGEAAGPKLSQSWVFGGLLALLALIVGGVFLNSRGRAREAERRRKTREAASFGEYGEGKEAPAEKPGKDDKPKKGS